MSQDMQLTITARDQASKVIEGVEKRVANFGKQFGQQLVGMVAPMALVGMAIAKIGQHFEELAQKRKEAFDWGASLEISANKMEVTVEAFQAIEAAADVTGESVDKVGKSFKLASDLIASARGGNLEAADSLAALGINLVNLEKTTPQDVLRQLAGALATTEDPAKRAQIAIAALGKSAADLQETLAKGFDIAGAIEGTEGLTNEEAALLRQQAREERAKQNKEKLAKAKDAVRANVYNRMVGEGRVQEAYDFITNKSGDQEAIMAEEVAGMVKKDKKATGQKGSGGLGGFVDAARALIAKGQAAAEKEKEDEEKKKPKPRKGPKSKEDDFEFTEARQPTVSSLRAIGGGMAGEVAGLVDFQRNSLEVQKQIRDILAEIKNRGNIQNTDFTKPVPNIVAPPSLMTPSRPSLTGSSGTMLA